MCSIAGIRSLVVDGYIKNKPQQINQMGILAHAWNAIVLNNKTYYFDLTWASGYCEIGKKGKLKGFVKRRQDFYWMMSAEEISKDHFPKEPENVPNFNVSKEDFKNQVYIETNTIPYFQIIAPSSKGILKVNMNDTIQFKLKYENDFDILQINTNLQKNPKMYYQNKKGQLINRKYLYEKQEFKQYTRNQNIIEFEVVIGDKETRYMEVLLDYQLKIKYLIEVEKVE